MGYSGIGKCTVSKLCKEINERVVGFLERPLEGEWPYLWLDATCLRVRAGSRIVSVAAIIAVAVDSDGRREIVGLDEECSGACAHRALPDPPAGCQQS
jgi:transposase-like protein